MADDDMLRVGLNGRWTATEFSELFSTLQFLYDAAQFGQLRIDGQSVHYFDFFERRENRLKRTILMQFEDDFDWEGTIVSNELVRTIQSYGRQRDVLRVRKFHYGSPGVADLVGIGKIVEQVRIFALEITDRYIHRQDRILAREEKRQDILAKKLNNAKKLIDLNGKAGFEPDALNDLLRQILRADYFIEGKVIDGKITYLDQSEEEDA